MDKLAIVILNYNGLHFLEKFLTGINTFSSGFPVYIADNASTDGSVEFLKKHYPGNPLILHDRNLGFAGGYNKSLAQIEAEYFILLNSDIEVSSGWIDPMLDFMEERKEFAACQPKILSCRNREYFEYAGAGGGFIDRYGYPFCRGRIFSALEKDEDQYSDTREIFWASGACMMIRAELFHRAGGFDADFFAHMEEIDLCWRLKRSGWKIGYVGKSTVFHVGGGTLSAGNPYKTYLNFRNNHSMLVKNLYGRDLMAVLMVRMVLDLAASANFLISGSPRDAWAVLKGLAASCLNFRVNRKKRRKEEEPYPNKKLAGIYHKSILMAYYFRGIRKFSQLDFQ